VALVVLGFVSAACDVAFQGLNASATDTWQRRYTLSANGRFELSNVNGAVEVTPSADATSVEVVAERKAHASTEQAARDMLKSARIDEQASADAIKVSIPRQGGGMHVRRSLEVTFKVKVPKTVSLVVGTVNGEVHVTGVQGAVKIRTTNGAISGEEIGGALDAGTTNGEIRVQVTTVQPDGIRLDTTNGAVDLRMPADAKATIAARWRNGGFDASGLKPEGETDRHRYDGKLNGGGPRIELSTTNGSIRISS
jgi:DUF4097 and DUF4098 domain-containing protein YvlB